MFGLDHNLAKDRQDIFFSGPIQQENEEIKELIRKVVKWLYYKYGLYFNYP